jgi:hypothetical protein
VGAAELFYFGRETIKLWDAVLSVCILGLCVAGAIWESVRANKDFKKLPAANHTERRRFRPSWSVEKQLACFVVQ